MLRFFLFTISQFANSLVYTNDAPCRATDMVNVMPFSIVIYGFSSSCDTMAFSLKQNIWKFIILSFVYSIVAHAPSLPRIHAR